MSAQPESGLLAWLESTRVALPLKGVEVRFHLVGDVVEVTVDQIYHQDQARPLDVTYAFPLPDVAAVHRCELHVHDRIISAQVRLVEEARKLAADWSAKGHRTTLVESVRPNLFELGLGNLAPGDTVRIRLGYVQSVETAGADAAQFRIPLTPGIRYVPGELLLRRNSGRGAEDDTDLVADASRLSPPRIDGEHPDAAYLVCEGTMEPAGWDAEAITSPSHTLVVQGTDGDGPVRIRLASQAEVPNRDIVIRLQHDRTPDTVPDVTAAAWATDSEPATQGFRHVLARVITPRLSGGESVAVARDFYFLMDRSGSMEGVKWTACCRALRQFLKLLSPLDRAWVTFFESSFQDLAEKPLPAAAILAEPVIGNLEAFGTAGGTELHAALVHLLSKLDRHSAPERMPALVLVTDGQVGDEARIHEVLEGRSGLLPVHTIGIDTAVNDAFLKRIAEASGGSCILASPADDIVGLVTGLAHRTRLPAVTGLRIEGAWESADALPSALWQEDAVTLSFRCPRETAGECLLLHGIGHDGAPVSWSIPIQPCTGEAPRLLWYRRRIRFLERQGRQVAADEVAQEANLLSAGTAFVAWDEAERLVVQGPNASCFQPSLQPDGWCGMIAPAAAPITGKFLLASGIGGGVKASPAKSFFGGKKLRSSPPHLAEEAAPAVFMPRARATAAWQGTLPDWLGLPEETAIRFIDWVEQWLWTDPSRRDERERELEAWIVRNRGAFPTVACRREALLNWIGSGTDAWDATIRHAVTALLAPVVPKA